jgi:hypothetical protein
VVEDMTSSFRLSRRCVDIQITLKRSQQHE